MGNKENPDWALYMGTFPPRECGIATFTKDLTTAMDRHYSPSIKSKILAMDNEITSSIRYGKDVILRINAENIREYINAAKKINRTGRIKLVNIQHEFGLFGGEYGSYLLEFLNTLTKPVVITFHTVLPKPNEKLKEVVQLLADKSECIIVMNRLGVGILRNDYEIETDIQVIPHGIPDVVFGSQEKEKEMIGRSNRIVLSSFGMMNSGKGYEWVIDALPDIIEKFPNIIYLIVGETHPVVRKREGEAYRNFLKKKVKETNLQKNVKFLNKYFKLDEIIAYLKATDIYVCSNVNPEQITSGTLAYAIGTGRAVVSTPFLHAQEIVTPEVGVLVEFNNPRSFADAITRILSNQELKEEMEKNAYRNTRHMTWNNVASAYKSAFEAYASSPKRHGMDIPKINLDHLVRLTDNFGIAQFANKTEPDTSFGYAVDDNARAMITCCMNHSISKDEQSLNLITKYLNFIRYVQEDDGKFYNFVDEKAKVNYRQWSEDAHGRALWSLGYLINTGSIPVGLKKEAEQLFIRAESTIKDIKSPRAVAFMISGLYFYNKAHPDAQNIDKIKILADYLASLYKRCSSKNWQWFEECITYSNSKLPESLFYAYLATNNRRYLRIAQSSLDFLKSSTFKDDVFAPIGNEKWYTKEGEKSNFDQQPVDAASMVQTLILAHQVTNNNKYLEDAFTAFGWFLGKNSLNKSVYDRSSGGCHDGIGESSLNLNQGAESTISYLLARLSLSKYEMEYRG